MDAHSPHDKMAARKIVPTSGEVLSMDLLYSASGSPASSDRSVCCVVFANGCLCLYELDGARLLCQSTPNVAAQCVLGVPAALVKNEVPIPQAWIGHGRKKGVHCVSFTFNRGTPTTTPSDHFMSILLYRLDAGNDVVTHITLLGGRSLVTDGSNCELRVWDVETRSPTWSFNHAELISPPGPFVCLATTGLSIWGGCQDGSTVILSSGSTKSEPEVYTFHIGSVNCILLVDHAVLTGGDDGKIFVWDAWAHSMLGILDEHTGPVTALARVKLPPYSRDEVWSASKDGSICIWDAAANFVLLERLPLEDPSAVIRNIVSEIQGAVLAGGEMQHFLTWKMEPIPIPAAECEQCRLKEQYVAELEEMTSKERTKAEQTIKELIMQLKALQDELARSHQEQKSPLGKCVDSPTKECEEIIQELQKKLASSEQERDVQQAALGELQNQLSLAKQRQGAAESPERNPQIAELQAELDYGRRRIEELEECLSMVRNERAADSSHALIDEDGQLVKQPGDVGSQELRGVGSPLPQSDPSILDPMVASVGSLLGILKGTEPPDSVATIDSVVFDLEQLVARHSSQTPKRSPSPSSHRQSSLPRGYASNALSQTDRLEPVEPLNFRFSPPREERMQKDVQTTPARFSPDHSLLQDNTELKRRLREVMAQLLSHQADTAAAEVAHEALEVYAESLLATIDCLYLDRMQDARPETRGTLSSAPSAVAPSQSSSALGTDKHSRLPPQETAPHPLQSPMYHSPGSRSPNRPIDANDLELVVRENQSMRLQLRLLHQVLRNPENVEMSEALRKRGDSTAALTACFLTIRETLGEEIAGRIILDALKGEVTDEIDAIERLVHSMCQYFWNLAYESAAARTAPGYT